MEEIKCNKCGDGFNPSEIKDWILTSYKEKLSDYGEHCCEGCIENEMESAYENQIEIKFRNYWEGN